MKPIPYGRQHITDADIEIVSEVLKSDYLTQGPRIEEFEKSFAEYIGATFAVAVSNGTAALHLACLALDLNESDKVITTPITFAASANCVRYCGGEVIFCDIDERSYLIDLEKLETLLKEDSTNVKGIVIVDFAGYPADLERLREIANKYTLWIIEDACHAPGGSFTSSNETEEKCGNGNWADCSVFSFHPVKHIATGEGGMVTTNSKAIYDKLVLLRTHGITKRPDLLKENHGGWYYEMVELGYNYRITDMQAALGSSQLKRANIGVEKRNEIARKYLDAFKENENIKCHEIPAGIKHAYHLFIIEVDDRLGLYNHLRSKQIYSQVHYIPLHTLPYYQGLGWSKGDFPVAENYYDRCLSIPMFPTLSEEEQDFVIKSILGYYDA